MLCSCHFPEYSTTAYKQRGVLPADHESSKRLWRIEASQISFPRHVRGRFCECVEDLAAQYMQEVRLYVMFICGGEHGYVMSERYRGIVEKHKLDE